MTATVPILEVAEDSGLEVSLTNHAHTHVHVAN